MRERHANLTDKRLSINNLIVYAGHISKEKENNKGRMWCAERGEEIRNTSVYEFYEVFRMIRESDTSNIQKWISMSIAVTLGYHDTKALSMRVLANKISEAINRNGLSRDDRWALYELCFMLTALMSVDDHDVLIMEELACRQGTPDESEPNSLYNRVAERWFRGTNDENCGMKKANKMSLQKLLKSVEDENCSVMSGGKIDVTTLTVHDFLVFCLVGKLRIDGDDERDRLLELEIRDQHFSELFTRYSGSEMNETNRLPDFVDKMTKEFLARLQFGLIKKREVLKAYELCYEFINLLADEEYSKEHTTLMAIELPEECNDLP